MGAMKNDPPAVMVRARKVGVERVLVPGCTKETSESAVLLAQKFLGVYATVGFHPTNVDEVKESDLEWLEKLLLEPKVVGVGECGLDFFHVKDEAARKRQENFFRLQLRLVRKKNLPVTVHAREAVAEAIGILKEEKIKKAVFHCYSGPVEWVDEIVKNGWYISFTGIITYPKADEVRRCLQKMPEDKFFLETDAPYLAPQSARGQENEPAYLVEVAMKAAEVRGVGYEKMIKDTTKNALKFFGIKD